MKLAWCNVREHLSCSRLLQEKTAFYPTFVAFVFEENEKLKEICIVKNGIENASIFDFQLDLFEECVEI